jgi:hypothetical protein
MATLAQASGALLAALLSTAVAAAQPSTEPTPAAVDEKTEAARRHFQNGIKLYQDGNYAGALAEFEAAYALKPGPSSLKNIALSQKALYRYAEAADTLTAVLGRHAAELGVDERRTVQQAIDELSSLVGSIVLRVTPASARVTLDGRPVESPQRSATGIRLNVGEHTVTAEAPGHARAARTFRVAGGQKDVPIEIQLAPTAGFVTVTARDSEAAIAVDNVAKAFERWHGPLEPGRHLVQVYRLGYRTFEQPILVWQGTPPHVDLTRPERTLLLQVGQSTQIDVPPLEPKPADEDTDPQSGDPLRQSRGWYGLVALSFLGMRDAPSGLDVDESEVTGGSFGVRAGYRLWTPIAVEMMLEGSRHQVKKACDTFAPQGCGKGEVVWHDYTLESVRLGPNLRIMSSGETVRFTSTLGAGAVRHVVEVGEPEGAELQDGDPRAPTGKAKGWDPYFLLEVGAQFNWGHILMEANVTAFIDGASNAKGPNDFEPFEDTGGLVMVGLGLRGGWSEWAPAK